MTTLQDASVLVTGGAGFIGSHVVDRLLENETVARVRVIDNLVNGRSENLAAAARDPRFEFVKADIRDEDQLDAALDGVSVVMHLACLGVRHSLHAPLENHEVNATATLNLLEIARRKSVDKFVHVSTSEVYGTARYAPMDEGHPTFPETVYGGSKLAGEAYARAAYRTHRMPVVVARPFNTYGPRSHFEGDSGEVIPRTIVRALCGLPALIFGDGKQTRDFTQVRDTAAGLISLVECDAAIGETVNLGSGKEIEIAELCAMIARMAGCDAASVHLSARPGDVRRLVVDPTLIESLTAFTPSVSLKDGGS